jgi:hypothetical protein
VRVPGKRVTHSVEWVRGNLKRCKLAGLVALQFGDAVGYVAIINIHRVDLAEAVERLYHIDATFGSPLSMKQRPSMVEQFIV